MDWTTILGFLGIAVTLVVTVAAATWRLRTFLESMRASLEKEMRRGFAEAKEEREKGFAEAREERREIRAEAKEEREKGFAEAKEEREKGFAAAKEERREIKSEMNRRFNSVEKQIGRLHGPYFRPKGFDPHKGFDDLDDDDDDHASGGSGDDDDSGHPAIAARDR